MSGENLWGVYSKPNKGFGISNPPVGMLAVHIAYSISIAPNPFRELVIISYELPQNSEIKLNIYNIRGQLMKRLYRETQTKRESKYWLGKAVTMMGTLPAGAYLLQMSVDGISKKPQRILKL